MNGSVPETGALAHLFPINIKSWTPIIYAREEPLIICTIKPTVGANEIRNDWGKTINLRVEKNFKPNDFAPSHCPIGMLSIAPRQTSAEYALVKIVKESIAAIQGLTSISKNLGIPKPNIKKSIRSGADWNSQMYEIAKFLVILLGITLSNVMKAPTIPPPTKAISER